MEYDIKDLATVKEIRSHLKGLVEACHPKGAFYAHDMDLANAVARDAKNLQASLGYLEKAVEDPHHRPKEPVPSMKSALGTRLYQERHLHELARFVSYGGRRADQVKAFMVGHKERHGDKAMWALIELTEEDKATGLTVLRPEAKKACRVLLGPSPGSEEYEGYWPKQGCEPPAEHLPQAAYARMPLGEKSPREKWRAGPATESTKASGRNCLARNTCPPGRTTPRVRSPRHVLLMIANPQLRRRLGNGIVPDPATRPRADISAGTTIQAASTRRSAASPGRALLQGRRPPGGIAA